MRASDILHLLRESGLTVSADDGRLIVQPAELLTDETRQLIREHKHGILAELASDATSFVWLVHFSDRDPVEVYCHPDESHAGILKCYPDAFAAEPIPD